MLRESVVMSWENIVHNKLRSFLTTLGIMIGVAAIIALITVMEGAQSYVTNQISSLGAETIMLQVSGTPLKRGINRNDLLAIEALPNVEGVSPSLSAYTTAAFNGETYNVSIQGRSEMFFKMGSDLLKAGRGLVRTDVESSARVAVIGSRVEQNLFFGRSAVGEELILNSVRYTIVGVLNETNVLSMNSTNRAVIIPYTAAMKGFGVASMNSLDVVVDGAEHLDSVIEDIERIMNAAFNYKEDAFSLFKMVDMIEAMGDIASMMTTLLAGIAAISLVVGGIGIMNMMLVSVTERTAEIGLRKALGATPFRIQAQFIIESIFLSLFGGLFGLCFGAAIAWAAGAIIGISLGLSLPTVALAIGFSGAVGVIFGFMPARKASRLNPIDALRHN